MTVVPELSRLDAFRWRALVKQAQLAAQRNSGATSARVGVFTERRPPWGWLTWSVDVTGVVRAASVGIVNPWWVAATLINPIRVMPRSGMSRRRRAPGRHESSVSVIGRSDASFAGAMQLFAALDRMSDALAAWPPLPTAFDHIAAGQNRSADDILLAAWVCAFAAVTRPHSVVVPRYHQPVIDAAARLERRAPAPTSEVEPLFGVRTAPVDFRRQPGNGRGENLWPPAAVASLRRSFRRSGEPGVVSAAERLAPERARHLLEHLLSQAQPAPGPFDSEGVGTTADDNDGDPANELADAIATHATVKEAFTAYCFDPYAVLTRPLLGDVRDPLTAAFYTAQEEATALEPSSHGGIPESVLRRYVTAVRNLARAWDRADAHAREIGVARLTQLEQNNLRQARRALDLALDPRTPAAEREVAYRRVLGLIDGLVTLPEPARRRIRASLAAPERPALGDVSSW